ncbi:MAG: SPOR domain-containing protein [Prolixibacteraceae bacterium]|nr:SPOR domain-containing protein [Prolixibacteraceae bacterium]
MNIGRTLLLMLVVIALFSCQKEKPADHTHYQPYQRDTTAAVSAKKETAKEEAQTPKDSPEAVHKSQFPVNLDHKYFIVIASYTVEEYALETLDEVSKEGFTPKLFMQNKDGWYKLAVESFQNIEQADSALNKVREKGSPYTDARIVVK